VTLVDIWTKNSSIFGKQGLFPWVVGKIQQTVVKQTQPKILARPYYTVGHLGTN
jgi:hypothetical protein